MQSTAPVPSAPKLGFSSKFWFGFGQAAEGIKNGAFGGFLFFFYSQVLGLDPRLAGAAAAIALVFDAITDPLTGSLSDALRSRWGRRHPFMYAAALPMAVTFFFVFSPPDGLGQTGLFLWMLSWTVLARAAMTLYHVPHLALGAELTEDYAERTVVVAYRIFFGVLGMMLLFLVSRYVFMAPTAEFAEGQRNPAAYPTMAFFFGAVMMIAIIASALGTHSRIRWLPTVSHQSEPFGLKRLLDEMRAAISNPSFRAFFLGLLFFFVARGLETALGLHMGTYFWKIGSEAVLLPAIGGVGLLIGTPFWAVLSRKLDKKPTFLIGITGFSAVTMLLPISKLVGLYPSPESPFYLGLLYTGTLIAAFAGAAGMVAAGSMLADIADEHELETERRQEGMFFGALSFSGKASAGLGIALSGFALWAIDFPAKAAPEAVDAWSVTKLGLVYGPGVLGLIIVAIAITSRYRLSRTRHAHIRAALDSRREAARAAAVTGPRDEVANQA